MKTRVLTGITTSGTPHLGNYAGAIRPSIQASRQEDVDAFYFMADYHALIKCDDPQRVARSRLEIAATWIAAGLDVEKVTFYRQSDIPEIPELCWMLSCVTAKGLMNRAHAYKASVDQNVARQIEPDDGITMGLFSYPVLMAADILLFNAHKVPVGRDQIQHLEMARDIAQRFNHLYGQGEDFFVLPQVLIDDDVATLPGLDGRKMSKSYDNTIPLFEGGEQALRAAVMRIVTDSRQPGEPKDPDSSHLTVLYRAFAESAQAQAFRQALQDGMGWGEAKAQLFQRIQDELAPMRARYAELIAAPGRIEDILQAGAEKARRIATPLMQRLREAVGIRALAGGVSVVGGARADGSVGADGALREAATPARAAENDSGAVAQGGSGKKPRFVSFRDEGGQFRFRLLAGDGQQLFLSEPFANPRQAGEIQKRLLTGVVDSQAAEQDVVSLLVDGEVVAAVDAANLPLIEAALAALRAVQD